MTERGREASKLDDPLAFAPAFSSHMVLQCEKPLRIWGFARPGEEVKVVLGKSMASSTADKEGRWEAALPPMPPGGPYELTAKSETAQVGLIDVLLGEVWLCGGQSNMNWGLIASDGGEEDLRDLAEKPTQRVRLLRVPQSPSTTPETRLEAGWTACTPGTARDFSAIGYRFARQLERVLDRPVGMIHANWGGTPVEAWLPLEILQSEPAAAPALERHAKAVAVQPEARRAYEKALEDWEQRVTAGEYPDEKSRNQARPREPDGTGSRNAPAESFNGIIAPLIPMTLRGVLWYQGESNVGHPRRYEKLFPLLISTWRKLWNDGFPFYFVQLPQYADPARPGAWAELREAQAAALVLPATGMVVAIDCGDPENIHPRDKKPISDRLANLALKETYGSENAPAGGPRIGKVEFLDNGSAVVSIEGGSPPLRTPDNAAPLGFELAGTDGVFHRATARIDGPASLSVQSTSVPRPVALRYAFANAPQINLRDNQGLPLAPFRTAVPEVGTFPQPVK
ncbi:MAG: sialate O-acetylesterase [Terrimicrobiaceae bacterium]